VDQAAAETLDTNPGGRCVVGGANVTQAQYLQPDLRRRVAHGFSGTTLSFGGMS